MTAQKVVLIVLLVQAAEVYAGGCLVLIGFLYFYHARQVRFDRTCALGKTAEYKPRWLRRIFGPLVTAAIWPFVPVWSYQTVMKIWRERHNTPDPS